MTEVAEAGSRRRVESSLHRARREICAGAVGLALDSVLSGCGLNPWRVRREIEVAGHEGLSQAILDVHEDHQPRLVDDAVDCAWDEFTIYTIGTPAEVINEKAGVVVETGDYYNTQEILLLFLLGGIGVRGVPLGTEALSRQARESFGSRSRIVWDENFGVSFENSGTKEP